MVNWNILFCLDVAVVVLDDVVIDFVLLGDSEASDLTLQPLYLDSLAVKESEDVLQ